MDKKRIIFALIALCTLLPFVSAALALLTGIIVSAFGFKDERLIRYTSLFLKASIVLMGFGMSLSQVIEVSSKSFVITAASLVFVFVTGGLLGRVFRLEKKTALLISCGTAICGGSAIAAAAPVVHPKSHQLSFALTVVFVLNAVGLLLFPIIGHYFHMSQEVFGYWAAIAIHDTSSVVGAGAAYGDEALKIATTVKLVRALWIVPVTFVLALVFSGKEKSGIKIPWFIGLFLLAIVITHFMPQLESLYEWSSFAGSRGMVLALFLIGSEVTVRDLKKAGIKSFVMGFLLWVLISIVSLMFLLN
ncbi:YeiH family protein [Carboxylicivirga sp. RSCT41]|uniref:YeiH family protein n=1 Tax=Carboxylicivirga agarovorans TaxID=3417570 RepID=UPI003D33FFF9